MPVSIRPYRRFPVQRSVMYHAGPFQRPRHEFGSQNEARRAGDAQIFRQRAVAVDDGLSFGIGHVGFKSLGIKADFARDSQNRCFFLQSQDSGWNRFPSPLTEQMPNRTSCP